MLSQLPPPPPPSPNEAIEPIPFSPNSVSNLAESVVQTTELEQEASLIVPENEVLTAKHRLHCPKCWLLLPFEDDQTYYNPCCGRVMCKGCVIKHFSAGSSGRGTCPFCYTARPKTDAEFLARTESRVETHKDGYCLFQLAVFYNNGLFGLQPQPQKALSLCRRSAEMGCPEACYSMAREYDPNKQNHCQGVKQGGDWNTRIAYLKEAAKAGHLDARGALMDLAKDDPALVHHAMIASCAGYGRALEAVKCCYMRGDITKKDYTKALRRWQMEQDKRKSPSREYARTVRSPL